MNSSGDLWINMGAGVAHRTAEISSSVTVGAGTLIEEYCIVGKPHRKRRLQDFSSVPRPTWIGEKCYIQTGSIIYEDVHLGADVICADRCLVSSGARVGKGTKIQYMAQVNHEVHIGEHCRIGGFLCNGSRVGNRASIYGSLVHHYSSHGVNAIPGAPLIEDDVIVGFHAAIIGGVNIGAGSYVAASAVVTRDVPPDSVVIGVNKVFSKKNWHGRLYVLQGGQS